MLTKEQERELSIDTMVSWALAGMEPDRQTVEDINSYIDGRLMLGEFIEKSKAL